MVPHCRKGESRPLRTGEIHLLDDGPGDQISDAIGNQDLLAVLAGNIRLVAMVPISLGCCMLLHNVREILLRDTHK